MLVMVLNRLEANDEINTLIRKRYRVTASDHKFDIIRQIFRFSMKNRLAGYVNSVYLVCGLSHHLRAISFSTSNI